MMVVMSEDDENSWVQRLEEEGNKTRQVPSTELSEVLDTYGISSRRGGKGRG